MEATGIIIAVVGLVVTVLVIGGVFFTLYKVFGGLKRSNQERERLLREGVQASARVTSVQMGGMTMTVGVHRHLQLQIGLEVYPAGRPPYPALLTTMISELQIPQIQPGVSLTVRYDAHDPMKLALEGVGAPAAAHYAGAPGAQPAPGYAPPGGPPGYGAHAQPYGAQPYGMPQGMQPVHGVPGMPAGAKIGLVVGLIGAVVGIGVAVVVVAINVFNVGVPDLAGGDGADSTKATAGGVCAQAARCCVSIGGPPDACKNLGRVGVPDAACQSALDGYLKAASAMGKSCN